MNKLLLLIAILSALLAASRVQAFHADIFVTQQAGTLFTGRGAADPGSGGSPQVGVRFHVNDIAGLTPFVDTNPGFSAAAAGDSFFLDGTYQALPGSRNLGFNIRAFRIKHGAAANLFYWNGTGDVDFQPVSNPHDSLEVRLPSLGSALATGAATDVPGFDFTATDPTGSLHSHLVFDFDVDNNSGTAASTGVFLTAFEFNMHLAGDDLRAVARPHYVAWFNGPPGALKTNAMAAANSFLTEEFAGLRLFGDVSPLGIDDLPDDRVDADDIGAIVAAVDAASGDPVFDLNDDTKVTSADVAILFDILGTRYGDANLDGLVNAGDLAVWQEHYGTMGGWADGDFNSDTNIDGRDFLVWQRHVGFGAAARAITVVPEPVSIAVLTFGIVLVLGISRQGATTHGL